MLRLSVFALALLQAACSAFTTPTPSVDASVTLELVRPEGSEPVAFVQYRVRRTGPHVGGAVYAARANAPEVVVSRGQSETVLAPDTIEGVLTFPVTIDRFEVWADVIPLDANFEQAPAITTARQVVSINSQPIIAAPLTSTNTQATLLLTGTNAVDTSTLETIKVDRSIAVWPYVDVPEQRGFGLEHSLVPVTAMVSGNRLVLSGDFRGPGFFRLVLDGVRNIYGSRIESELVLARPYFKTVLDLGRTFISGVGIAPHFERAADGTLFLVMQGVVYRLGPDGAWSELARFTVNDTGRAHVNAQGTLFLSEVVQSGLRVARWDGAAFEELPVVPFPPEAASPATGTGDAIVGGDGQLVAMTAAQDVNTQSHVTLHRLSAGQWTVLAQAPAASTRAAVLHPFGRTVAIERGDALFALEGGVLAEVPSPRPLLDAISAENTFEWSSLRVDADGDPWVLGQFVDPASTSSDFGTRASGMALFEFSGGAWQPRQRGNRAEQGWYALRNMPASVFTHFKDFGRVRAWWLEAGAPVVVLREETNPLGLFDTGRFILSAYAWRADGWRALPDAPSPMLETSEGTIPQEVPEGSNVVAHDAVRDASGRLWLIQQESDRFMPSKETFKLVVH